MSFCLLHAFEWVLDGLSSRTNGAFGSTTPTIPAHGHHGINPKDSAHDTTNPNGKTAIDEEVSPFAARFQVCSVHTIADMHTLWSRVLRPLQMDGWMHLCR